MQTDRDCILMDKPFPYADVTYRIIGILFKVHNKLGPTYQEKYYQRAVEEELRQEGLRYEREKVIEITYNGKKIGKYAIDFVIENCVVLELKAVKYLDPKYFNQVLAYLNILQIRVALIANFRKPQLEYKRIILPDQYLRKSA